MHPYHLPKNQLNHQSKEKHTFSCFGHHGFCTIDLHDRCTGNLHEAGNKGSDIRSGLWAGEKEQVNGGYGPRPRIGKKRTFLHEGSTHLGRDHKWSPIGT